MQEKYSRKVKQVSLAGLLLRMFEYDVKYHETNTSARINEILREYYKKHPPIDFIKSQA